jgi:hypothetical protein
LLPGSKSITEKQELKIPIVTIPIIVDLSPLTMAPEQKVGSSSDVAKYHLLGTRIVVLHRPDDDSSSDFPTEAQLAVHHHHQQQQQQQQDVMMDTTSTLTASTAEKSSSHSKLRVDICNGNSAFSIYISPSEVNLPANDKGKLSLYLLQDGNHHPTILIRFQYNHDGSIKLIIKRQLSEAGMMLHAYEGQLLQEEDSPSKGVLGFLKCLGDSFNDTTKQMEQSKVEHVKLTTSLKEWKDTAQKLSQDVWQAEKDQLLRNFQILLNEMRANFQERIQTLEEALELEKLRRNDNWGKRGRLDKNPTTMVAAEDDLDEPNREPIPMEQVTALAEGKKTQRPLRKSVLDSNDVEAGKSARRQCQPNKKNESSELEVKEEQETINVDTAFRDTIKKQATIKPTAKRKQTEPKTFELSVDAAPTKRCKSAVPVKNRMSSDKAPTTQTTSGLKKPPDTKVDVNRFLAMLQDDDDDDSSREDDDDLHGNSSDEAMRKEIRDGVLKAKASIRNPKSACADSDTE